MNKEIRIMARQPKKTTVTVEKNSLEKVRADMLALGLFKDTKRLPAELATLDKAAGQVISNLLKLGDFTGAANQTAVLYTNGSLPYRRILLVGLGDKKSFRLDTLRQAAGAAARTADNLGAARLAMALHSLIGEKLDLELVGQAVTEGAIAGHYDYQDYLPVSKDSKEVQNLRISLIDRKAAAVRKLNAGRKIGITLAEAQNRARMIDNKPGNEINPPSLARQAQKLARQYGLKCKIFDDKQLANMKMNAILAVGGGSASKPRLIMLEYNGRRRAARDSAPDAVIVGKAITFDSGGISIKPSANMETMKYDKSGGCNVLGILTGVAQLKLPLNVVGLIPAAENLPSHTSYRPGDIIRTYSGKTVEVQNTDAEGRMILCDALHYAAKMKPKAIVDMATLTGACVIALGEHNAGLFSNNEPLRKAIERAARTSGESVWHLPSGEEYLEQMKSKMADLKNVSGREGGACTAAAFLGAFVDDTPWAHIDIAAVADTDKAKPYRAGGATGFAVRLVLEYLRTI
jgi:leucyl aminopeptidase